MRNFEYAEADTSTEHGLRRAEQLKARGWKIYFTGLFIVKFVRRSRPKANSAARRVRKAAI